MMNDDDDDDSNLLVSSKFDLKAGVPRYSGARLPTRMDARANGKTTDRRAPTGNDGRITWENFVLGPGLLPRLGSTALLKLHIVFSYSVRDESSFSRGDPNGPMMSDDDD